MSTDNPAPTLKTSTTVSSIKSIGIAAATCNHRTRHIIALQSAFLMASLIGNINCWNAVTVKISELETSPLYESYLNSSILADEFDWADDTLSLPDRRVNLSQFQIGLIFGMSFVGAFLGVIPNTVLMDKYGSFLIMLINGVISTAATALTPIAVVNNFYVLLFLRILIGAAQCQLYPAIGTVVKIWAPHYEKAVFMAILTSYSQISALVTTLVASWLAQNYGWPSVFYVQAGFCAICILFWVVHFRDDPQDHPFLTDKEFQHISQGKLSTTSEPSAIKVPFYYVLRAPCVVALCLSMFAYMCLIQFNAIFFVSFLSWVMDLDIDTAGYLATIPIAVQLIVQGTTGILSDKITIVKEYRKIRIFNSLAFYIPAIGFFVASSFTEIEHRSICIAIILISLCMVGFTAGGFPKSSVLIGAQCPASVMACVQTTMTLSLCVGSFIVPGITPTRSSGEYALLFRIYAAVCVIANTFFLVFAKSKTHNFLPGSKKNSDDEIYSTRQTRLCSIPEGIAIPTFIQKEPTISAKDDEASTNNNAPEAGVNVSFTLTEDESSAKPEPQK